MKLSELVAYKNQLDALSTREAEVFADLELSKITYLANDPTLDENLNSVKQAFYDFNNTIKRIKNDLKLAIVEAEKPWFQESYRLHEQEIHRHPTEHILGICMQPLSYEFKNIIDSRLSLYANWHHAAMFIRPGNKVLLNQLVSFDPLYILDQTYDLLAPCIEQFPEQYQHRLRQYTIEDVNNTTFLDKMPTGQFALCVAYMYFNYKPFEITKQYFAEIFQKLKPGGTLAFTFNDCDRVSAVKLVEQRFCCYTPGFLVEQLAQSIGFEITYKWNDTGPVTWIELKKPGTLTSIKGGQSLGKIVQK